MRLRSRRKGFQFAHNGHAIYNTPQVIFFCSDWKPRSVHIYSKAIQICFPWRYLPNPSAYCRQFLRRSSSFSLSCPITNPSNTVATTRNTSLSVDSSTCRCALRPYDVSCGAERSLMRCGGCRNRENSRGSLDTTCGSPPCYQITRPMRRPKLIPCP